MLEVIFALLSCGQNMDCAYPITECECLNLLNDLGDEEVNWKDFDYLRLMVELQDNDGDLNRDGSVDADDLGDWITAYYTECVS